MQFATPENVLGNFDNNKVSFHDIETRLFKDGEIFKVATAGPGGKPGVFTIAYTFGHYPLQQYLIDTGKGHLQALNIAWDSRTADNGGQRWYHLQADETIDPEHPLFWTGHFQNANSRCIECHSTNLQKNFDLKNNHYTTKWAEVGVGCEACHGPASQHIALATANQLTGNETGFSKRPKPGLTWAFRGNDDIASPSGTGDESLIDTCGGCHSRRSSLGDATPLTAFHDQYRLALLDQGLYFADGQADDEVFVLGSFLQSKMQQQGVTCANCHNVHSGKLVARGNALCAQCHNPGRFDTQSHHHHQTESTGAQCVNCHMPERTYMTVDPRRDHNFAIPDPWLSVKSGTPNACTTCHRGKTNTWATRSMTGWGQTETRDIWSEINQRLDLQDSLMFKNYAENPPALDLPSIRQATLTSKLGAFPSRLMVEAVSSQLNSPDPLIRRAAVTALLAMPVQLRWRLLNPLIEDPMKSVRLEVASVLADAHAQLAGKDAERLGKLIDEYRESLNYNADSPAGQLTIGNLESRLGYSILAEQAYKKALEIESSFVPAQINLSDLYRSMGSDGKSRMLLERALIVAPDSAVTNHAYGLFLVRSGKLDEALDYLERATSVEDSNPRYVYVYAVALDSRGQTDAAIKVIATASKRWPNNLDLYFLQVSYMDKTGHTDGIHHYLSLLASIAVNNPQVRNWINKYGAGGSY